MACGHVDFPFFKAIANSMPKVAYSGCRRGKKWRKVPWALKKYMLSADMKAILPFDNFNSSGVQSSLAFIF
jgi:hypothetical protein